MGAHFRKQRIFHGMTERQNQYANYFRAGKSSIDTCAAIHADFYTAGLMRTVPSQ